MRFHTWAQLVKRPSIRRDDKGKLFLNRVQVAMNSWRQFKSEKQPREHTSRSLSVVIVVWRVFSTFCNCRVGKLVRIWSVERWSARVGIDVLDSRTGCTSKRRRNGVVNGGNVMSQIRRGRGKVLAVLCLRTHVNVVREIWVRFCARWIAKCEAIGTKAWYGIVYWTMNKYHHYFVKYACFTISRHGHVTSKDCDFDFRVSLCGLFL